MPKAIVLVCDDNPAIATSLKPYLAAESMDMISAFTGEEAIQIIQSQKINLLILDIMLPGINGLAVCKELRKKHRLPIIILSAKGEEADRIIGLELGADDYVTKPFSPHEVAVRARNIIQRGSEFFTEEDNEFRIGNLTLYKETLQVGVKNSLVQLTPREFKLLYYMSVQQGHVKTRNQLINAVWGADFEGEDRIVDTIVTRIRHRLDSIDGENPGIAITTVFGVGYKLEVL